MADPTSMTSRRHDVLAVHSLDHLCIAVPDLSVAEKFYSAFGLEVREEKEGLGLRTFGHAHRWVLLIEGPTKKLQYVSFGAFDDDMPRFEARLKKLGLERRAAPRTAQEGGLWCPAPDGVPIQIRAARKVTPDHKSPFDMTSTPGGVAGAVSRTKAPFVRPRRMSHIALFTPDVPRATRFYKEALGLRLSDQSGDILAFLHAVHGSDHHVLALAKSDGPGFHHASWDVGSPNEVGLGGTQMAAKGYGAGWGLGRHVLGSNYFFYVRDPWGSYSEYSSDIDFIPSGMDWHSGDHALEDSMFLWGPNPPDSFIANTETAL